MLNTDTPLDITLLSVSDLNREAKALLHNHFNHVAVTGEISNLSRPSSGHVYFTLKDATAQVRCAYFKFQRKQDDLPLENGHAVIVNAKVSLYEPRGDYQLIVTHITQQGVGQLQIAFERQKKQLEKKGLFDSAHKKPLPKLPHCIGIISSKTGAALQDILKVLQRRFPAIPIILYPATVQGEQAADQICQAITTANQNLHCDVLILARGGGSIEDLWSFNETTVAHAIYDSKIPIITGIGHQTDFTIADFVADVRAATPSAAAETATPDQRTYLAHINTQSQRLIQYLNNLLSLRKNELNHLKRRLKHPRQKLMEFAQAIDQIEQRLLRATQSQIAYKGTALSEKNRRLLIATPLKKISIAKVQLKEKLHQLKHHCDIQLTHRQTKLQHLARSLDAISPLKTLQRGYSITKRQSNHEIISSVQNVHTKETILTICQDGVIESEVTATKQQDSITKNLEKT